MKRVTFRIVFVAVLMLAGTSAALAHEAPWRFNASIYGWLPRAPVTIKVDGVDVASEPETLDNIIDDLEMAAMLEVEVHKGALGIFISPIYYDGKDDEDFRGPLGVKRTFTLSEDVWLIKYGASYDFGPWHLGKHADSPTVVLQPVVGAIYLRDKIRVEIDDGAFGRDVDVKTTLRFNTPIAGVNTLWDFSKRWSARIGGSYGGWDYDDVDSIYDGMALGTYHFKMGKASAHAFAGYRYIHLRYEKKDIEISVDIQGPLVGIGWDF